MTITIEGLPEGIHLTQMTPWTSQPKVVTHEIDGADFDMIVHTGRRSASATIQGYCARTADNIKALEDLKDGRIVGIRHSIEGMHTAMITALTPSVTAGGRWMTFSMTAVQQ